jgi:hypothetical protein
MRIMLKRDMLNRCYDINNVKKNYMRKVNVIYEKCSDKC